MKKVKSKKVDRFPGFTRIETEKEGIVNFGTNVWYRTDPFGVIIVYPTGQILKILPQDEINQFQRPNIL